MRRLIALAGWLLLAVATRGQGLNWDIDSFDVEIEVRSDASLVVTERIVADFSREPHRGIFREIPVRYRRAGSDFDMRVSLVSVRDGDGERRPYVSERRGDRIWMRIGRADTLLEGPQVYEITYSVRRGLLTFDTHDELYWNATGDEWPVPIGRASCVVRLPDGVPADEIRTQSFVGPHGTSTFGPDGTIEDGGVRFEVEAGLRAREGMTIVVGWPPGHVRFPGWAARLGWFISDNWIVIVPLLTAPCFWWIWRRFGRDRGDARSIVVRYEPPEHLTPLEVGTIIDERVNTGDITATLIDLAVRGYLRIDASGAAREGDIKASRVSLIRLREADDRLTNAEHTLFASIFDSKDRVKLSALEHKFYDHLPAIREDTYTRLADAGYFAGRPDVVRAGWLAIGIVWLGLVGLAAFALFKADVFPPLPLIIAGILTGPQALALAPFMPRKTAKGRRALEGIRGLEEYIARAEVEELDEQARRARFETLLPYAMALGLSEVWGEKFDGLFTPEPTWYDGPPGIGTAMLVSHLWHTTSTMGQTMTSQPRSSGGGGWGSSGFGGGGSGFSGGFSGGGGGGGGGGAW
ncbi:MAG: DUF2207 domain-containing protein [Phycisphaeraceae bacterium]|nr:DUF2207 domain-containing protein [Phycisphaeraceae bacterium]